MLGWREVELLIPKTESRQVLSSTIFENSSVCFHVRILLVCSKIHLYTLCTSWSWSWLLGVLHSPSLPSLVGCTLRFSLCFLSFLVLTLRCDRQRMCRLDGGWNFWFHKLLTTAYSKQVLNSLLLLRFYARKSIFCNFRMFVLILTFKWMLLQSRCTPLSKSCQLQVDVLALISRLDFAAWQAEDVQTWWRVELPIPQTYYRAFKASFEFYAISSILRSKILFYNLCLSQAIVILELILDWKCCVAILSPTLVKIARGLSFMYVSHLMCRHKHILSSACLRSKIATNSKSVRIFTCRGVTT